MKKSVWKSMVAPSIVTLLFSIYFLTFGIGVILTPANLAFKLAMAGIPGGIILTQLYVLYQRYTEIKGGFEDDLDNY